MKYCLVADDGQGRVVTNESDDLRNMTEWAEFNSSYDSTVNATCKWHVCRREPSANGENLVTLETWEKGQKV